MSGPLKQDSNYRIVEVDAHGKGVKDSLLQRMFVNSQYLPQIGSYLSLWHTRGEERVLDAEAQLDIPEGPDAREQRIYVVKGVEHVITAAPLHAIRMGESTGETNASGQLGEVGSAMQAAGERMKKIDLIERLGKITIMESHPILYVQRVPAGQMPNYLSNSNHHNC